jgi:Tfp pilus assembly protein PilN
MKRINKYQSGWTFWGLLFTLSVVGFAAYVGIRLVPVYSANENVKNAMELAMKDISGQSVSRSAIIRKMQAQLYLDGSHQLVDYKKALKLKRNKKDIILTVNYEREVPVIANVSLLVRFKNEVTKNSNG